MPLIVVEVEWPIGPVSWAGHPGREGAGLASDPTGAKKWNAMADAQIWCEDHAGEFPGATLTPVVWDENPLYRLIAEEKRMDAAREEREREEQELATQQEGAGAT